MREGLSYVKDSGDFMGKIKSVGCIPDGAFMVTADVVGLYPSIPHEGGLKLLKNRLNKRVEKVIPTDDLVSMAEIVLKQNVFEFNSKNYQQISYRD